MNHSAFGSSHFRAIEALNYPSACRSERIENTVSSTEKDQLLQLNI